jgi:hypothetical protein
MKIIITENQYKYLNETYSEEEERAKNIFFKIWQDELDSTGEIDFDPKIANYINYKRIGAVREFYADFLGGVDKMIIKSYQLMDRTFDTMDYDFRGGYDFKFRIKEHSDYEEDYMIFVDCPVESDGKVTLMTDNMETHYLKDLEWNEDLWWEIDSEIRSLIEDILYQEVTKKTGINVEVNMCWIKE